MQPTLYEKLEKEAFAILDEEDVSIKKLGEILVKGKKSLLWDDYERLKAKILQRRGEHNVEAAIMVAEEKLDVRLARCGIPPKVVPLLEKITQDRLVSPEEFELAMPDGTTYKKKFFDMTSGEKFQLLGEGGYIHKPKQQDVKPNRPKGQVICECKDVSYDVTEDTLILKGASRTHNASDVKFMVQRLHMRGELDDFVEALLAAKAEVEEEVVV